MLWPFRFEAIGAEWLAAPVPFGEYWWVNADALRDDDRPVDYRDKRP